MPTPRRHLALAALFSLLCVGCDCGATEGDPGAEASVPAPDGLLLELGFGDAPRFLSALGSQVRSPMVQSMIPAGVGDLLVRIADVPEEVAARVPEDAVLRGLMIAGAGTSPGWIYAVPVQTEESETHPLGVGVDTAAGAPAGGLWIGGPPTLERAPTELLDGLLLVATDVATLEAGMAYLRHRMTAGEAPAGLALRAPAGVVAERGRMAADAQLEEVTERALRGAAAERARHEEAPAFGDPERLIARLRGPLARWIAFLPDVGEVTVQLDAGPTGLELRAVAEVADGSPLASTLAELPTGEVFGLGALPPGTAIGFARRGTEGSAWIEAVSDVAGSRIGVEETAAMDAAHRGLSRMSSEGSLRAVGTSEAGPWALVAGGGPVGVEPDPVATILGIDYFATLLGRLLGCRGDASLSGWHQAERTSERTATLCREHAEGSTPQITSAHTTASFAVVASRRSGDGASPHPVAAATARAIAGTGGDTLSSRPDIARALAALGDEVSLAALLVPSRLPASAALVGAAAPDAAGGGLLSEPAPTFFAFGHDEGHARLTVLVAPHGLDRLAELAFVAQRILGGP